MNAVNSGDMETAQRMVDVTERLQELFTEALAEAGENYRVIGAQKNTAEEGGLKLHSRDSGIGERTYSFAELTAKGSIAGKVIPSSKTVFLKSDGSIDRSKIADAVIEQCDSIQTRAPIPTYYVKVHDIDKNVQITKKDLNHYYAVRSVVQARKNQGAVLTEANILGKLHAANAKK